jgi:hypothetical protein
MQRWSPPVATTRKEDFLLKRLTRTKKLFAFLRLHRHELFTDAFQEELEGMYRTTGAGSEPVPPAVLCMALLLQAYNGVFVLWISTAYSTPRLLSVSRKTVLFP